MNKKHASDNKISKLQTEWPCNHKGKNMKEKRDYSHNLENAEFKQLVKAIYIITAKEC